MSLVAIHLHVLARFCDDGQRRFFLIIFMYFFVKVLISKVRREGVDQVVYYQLKKGIS